MWLSRHPVQKYTRWLSLRAQDAKPVAWGSEENHKRGCILTLVWLDLWDGGQGGVTAQTSLGFESLCAPQA